jgi:hypothetical protein
VTSEKHPITETRLPTATILGHSNGDGWAGSSPMIQNHGHLGCTANPTSNPADAYWKNIYVFTSAIPWAGTQGTPVLSDIGDGEWLEMTISNPEAISAVHPFPSPFRYPNVRGSCYPNFAHSASPIASGEGGLGVVGGGTRVGIELPLMYRWLHHWQRQVGMVKLALSSTLFLRNERGGTTTPGAAATWFDPFGFSALTSPARPETYVDPSEGYFGWWKPYDYFDWAPATDRIYRLWLDKMEGAQAALPAGCKMDVRLVLSWLGENDTLGRTTEALEATLEKAIKAFIRRIRADLVENDWTTLAESEIPIIWPLPFSAYDNGNGSNALMREILAAIEADDPFFKTVESDNWSTLSQEGFTYPIAEPSTHFGPEGYNDAAADVYDAWLETQIEPFDALDEEQRVSVESVMSRVRTYYTRARVNTDVEDTPLLQHINGALFQIVDLVGDNAWFLRRRASIALDAGPNTPVTLPRYVHRLLKIETPEDVLRSVPFEQTGFVEGGKLQVLIRARASGTYTIHFITQPRELTRTEQLVPLPFQLVEWLVVETCRRLARASSNLALQASLEGETRQIQIACMRNIGAMQRSRNDRLQKQMRLPNPRVWRNRGRSFGTDLG